MESCTTHNQDEQTIAFDDYLVRTQWWGESMLTSDGCRDLISRMCADYKHSIPKVSFNVYDLPIGFVLQYGITAGWFTYMDDVGELIIPPPLMHPIVVIHELTHLLHNIEVGHNPRFYREFFELYDRYAPCSAEGLELVAKMFGVETEV